MLRNREDSTNSSSTSIQPGAREHSSRLPQPTRAPSRASPLKFFASSSNSKANDHPRAQKEWQAEFLNDLRFNRPARPGGSRPLPNRNATLSPAPQGDHPLRTSSALSGSVHQTGVINSDMPDRCSSAMSQRRVQSRLPTEDVAINNRGRPLVQHTYPMIASRDVSITTQNSMITPSATYRESGQRWMEKQEARSLREALEDMDIQDEERLHAAAQNEASELVWKHRNPNSPYKNPDAPYNYVSHLEKGSHARSQSMGRFRNLNSASDILLPGQKLTSEHSDSEKGSKSRACSESPSELGQTVSEAVRAGGTKGHALWDSPQKRAYMNMTIPKLPLKVSGHRQSSGSRARNVSGGLFRNPKDQIYEEPNEMEVETRVMKDPVPAPLQTKARNPVSKQAVSQPPFLRSETPPTEGNRKHSRYEIHKNPPSQSHNPSYLRNTLPPTPPDSTDASDSEIRSNLPSTKDGVEIRSDDIRAATSMRMKDRSPKLPSPTVVSDRRGRPIVSFEQDWKPKETTDLSDHRELDTTSALCPVKPHLPVSTVSAPAIPFVNLPEPPTIHINDEIEGSSKETLSPIRSSISSKLPSISVEEAPNTVRPLPTPGSKNRPKPTSRSLQHHSSTDPTHSFTPHWSPSPSLHRATAQCYACALPIAGRIVSAASQRFHPHCFTCHYCSTLLEHVAFYPEPDASRAERLTRIDARANGADLPEDEVEGKTADDDGDDGLRFYCHLDFHEKFSPRCRSCKTPIEGEVVVACGGEWHVGHFFCAECGDPFDSNTPFVEKEGFAWCVGCHTRRFSGKCRGCRKPIVDLVVRALGGEWHEGCFCCKVGTLLLIKTDEVKQRADKFLLSGVRRGI